MRPTRYCSALARLLVATAVTLPMVGCGGMDDPTRVAGWTLVDSAQPDSRTRSPGLDRSYLAPRPAVLVPGRLFRIPRWREAPHQLDRSFVAPRPAEWLLRFVMRGFFPSGGFLAILGTLGGSELNIRVDLAFFGVLVGLFVPNSV